MTRPRNAHRSCVKSLSSFLAAAAAAAALHAQPNAVRNNACSASSNSGTAYSCSVPNAVSFTYANGVHYWLQADVANTGPVTFNFNAAGAVPVTKPQGGISTPLAAGDIQAGQWVAVTFDGTRFQLQSAVANAATSSGSGSVYASGSFTSTTSGCPATVANCATVPHNLNTNSVVCTAFDSAHCVYGSVGGSCTSTTLTYAAPASTSAFTFGFSGSTSGTWACAGPPAAGLSAPTFSPGSGTYTSGPSVTISGPSGAVICYNLTGNPTAPTPGTCGAGSTTYSGPVTISASSTLYAIATEVGFANSSIASAAYVIGTTLSSPTFSPGAGSYGSSQTVTISGPTGATICYNTTGSPSASTPGTCDVGSTTYTGPVSVTTTETLYAIATQTGLLNSSVASAAYTIGTTLAPPTFSPVAGAYGSTQSVTISASSGATKCYNTTGSPTAPTAGTCGSGSITYTGPVSVASTETLYAIATEASFTTSSVASASYTIGTALSQPTFSPTPGTYSSTQSVTLSATGGATICYNFTGSPTAPTAGTCGSGSTTYTGAISVASTTTIYAIATETGFINSSVASGTYTISGGGSPTFVGAHANFFSVSGSNYSFPGFSVSANQTIYLTIGMQGACPTGGSAISNVMGNGTDSFTIIGSPNSQTFACIIQYKVGHATASGSYVITLTAPGQNILGSVLVFSGLSGTLDQNSSGTGASGTVSTGSMTTTQAAEVIVSGIFDYYYTDTFSAGSGYTIPTGATTSFASFGAITTEYQIVSSTGTYTPSFSVTGTGYVGLVGATIY